MAQSLALLAGAGNPNVAGEAWYRDATAPWGQRGELRMVMNLESIVKSVYFRSYWIQRNASLIRQYRTGVADVRRSGGNITEERVFVRRPGADEAEVASSEIAMLLTLVPPGAGLYKAWAASDASDLCRLVMQKLIAVRGETVRDWRYSPTAISPDNRVGSEADLEKRIDEPPLAADADTTDARKSLKPALEKAGLKGVLLVQTSSTAGGTFVQMPVVIVLAGAADWDADSIRAALSEAAGRSGQRRVLVLPGLREPRAVTGWSA